MTVGIYKITNNFTGRVYIGQSHNIERRYLDHNTPGHISEIVDRNISLYGKENFTYEILEECKPEELDEREIYYIDLYQNNGYKLYNKLRGGQESGSRIGENNGNAKLTESDVYNIREAYKNHKKRSEVYKEYEDKISESAFCSLWEGYYWKNTHMDVYTKENRDFYRGKIFTDDEVLAIRKEYITKTPEQIYEKYKDRCSIFGLKKVIYGSTYKYLPVYNKSMGKWIYK